MLQALCVLETYPGLVFRLTAMAPLCSVGGGVAAVRVSIHAARGRQVCSDPVRVASDTCLYLPTVRRLTSRA